MSFFFADPTGVGKTLTAKTLAKFLFGSEDALQRFDMSEYRHDFQVTRLYGAPPGYVGYESGGALTNAVKARPFTVLPRMTIFRITLLTISREAEGELFSFSTFLCSGVLKRSFSSGEAFSEPGTGPAPDACRLGLPDASPANTR
ncbi:MAG: ATP-dependent Clp protease ATP-binding subunit [bacterium]|nr:ATP-dependent Clp protease ATP-binding subunit [bacterium]